VRCDRLPNKTQPSPACCVVEATSEIFSNLRVRIGDLTGLGLFTFFCPSSDELSCAVSAGRSAISTLAADGPSCSASASSEEEQLLC
jgi:hypothetical protein